MIGIDRSVLRHLLAAALVVGCGPGVLAAPAEPTEPAPREGDASTQILGVELAFDATTGRLIPPAPEIVQQLRAALASTYAATHASPGATTMADGTRSVVLDERHAAFSIAHAAADGRISTRCVAGASSAEALLGATSASRREEE